MSSRIIAFVSAALLLASSVFAQKIESATGNTSTGAVTITTSAPSDYTQVIVKVCDKDGKVLCVANYPVGIEIQVTKPTATKVYASFTGPRPTVEVMKDSDITWQ